MRWILGFCLTFAVLAAATSLSQQRARSAPEILRISPTSGPEGTRVEIAGIDLEGVSAVFLGTVSAQFRAVSSQQLIAIVPHKSTTAAISVLSPAGRAVSPFAFAVMNDPRIPDEVSYKASYVNSAPKPENFTSARLWGIAIADTRFPQFRSAQVQVAWTRLSCMVDGHEVVLNDDSNRLRGGLYLREPWFGGHDYHEIMPVTLDLQNQAVVLLVGERADRVWHFWSPSIRASLPLGRLAGCTAKRQDRTRSVVADGVRLLAFGIRAGAGITTKPAPAIGFSPRMGGRRRFSATLAASGFDQEFRSLYAFGDVFPASAQC